MRHLMFALLLLFPLTAQAEQLYNPWESRWETVPTDSQLRYNQHENEWSYQPSNAKLEYNAFESQWDWDSGYNNLYRKEK